MFRNVTSVSTFLSYRSKVLRFRIDMPFAASLPHFYGRSQGFTKKFEGLHPMEKNHTSFTIVEPTMGVPMVQAARSQVNLVIPKFSSMFDQDYQLFSHMILPLFWIEYVSECLRNRSEVKSLNGVLLKIPVSKRLNSEHNVDG